MKIAQAPKGKGETVIIRIDRGYVEGRIFIVKPGVYDLLVKNAGCQRYSLDQIMEISVRS